MIGQRDGFSIYIHSNISESGILERLEKQRRPLLESIDVLRRNGCGCKEFTVTILGAETVISSQLRDSLFKTMRYFATEYGLPTSLNLLRVNQQASWYSDFIKVLHEEEHVISRLDIELCYRDVELRDCTIAIVSHLLRKNILTSLRITGQAISHQHVQNASIMAALHVNTSLENVWIDMTLWPGARWLRSLWSNLRLKTIVFRATDFGLEDVNALQELLSNPYCGIERVTLIDPPSSFVWKTSQDRKPNKSVRALAMLGREMNEMHLQSILSFFVSLRVLRLIGSSVKELLLPTGDVRRIELPKELTVLDLSESTLVNRSQCPYHIKAIHNSLIYEDDKKTLKDKKGKERTPDSFYRSVLRFKKVFPELRILGFDIQHPVFEDFSPWLCRQMDIPPSLWPQLFTLMSCLRGENLSNERSFARQRSSLTSLEIPSTSDFDVEARADSDDDEENSLLSDSEFVSSAKPPRKTVDDIYEVFQRFLSYRACGKIPIASTNNAINR